ncbi:MAG: hypothetical protein AAGI72_01460 [Pseudomonadota bacterium]
MTTTNEIMRKILALLLGCHLSLAAFAQTQAPDKADRDAAEAVIHSLQERWNRGDMTGYLARYKQDDSLRLAFGNTIVEGWGALDTLFRATYPDPERMGRFTIDRIETRLVDGDTALAVGNFTHVFPHETIKGGFTHVLQRADARAWVIVHERTSRGEVIITE